MSVTELTQPMTVLTPLGTALAVLVEVDNFEVYWCTFQRDTGECWWWRNHLIRLAPSITAGRVSTTPIKVSVAEQLAIDKARGIVK